MTNHLKNMYTAKTPSRILIVTKYRFIGDTLLAIPAIRSVASVWPNARITLLTGARACELMQNCPHINDFVEFDPYRPSDKGTLQYAQLILKLRRRRFDLALVLNRTFHSALTAFLSGAKTRVGWSGFQSRDFLLNRTCDYQKEGPEVECFLDVLRVAADGVSDDGIPELWLRHDEIDAARQHLPTSPCLIGVQPGATHGYKRWPEGRFSELIQYLLNSEQGCEVVLLGGPEEGEVAQNLMDLIPLELQPRVHNLVGRLTLRQSLASLTALDLFIGADTAIRHAAEALDTPTIALFGPTNARKWGNERLPRHALIVSSTGVMEDITVEHVVQQVQEARGCYNSLSRTISLGTH